jgi:radical SAM superfamily enzyme
MRLDRFKFFFSHLPRRNITTHSQDRNLLLISLDWTRPKDPPMALGHASILAKMHQKNLPVVERSYAVNKSEFSTNSVVEFILQNSKQNTDLAMGAFIWNENALQTILTQIRRNGFKGRIILGGPQVSYVKRGVEHYYQSADIFIRGYAEIALMQLMTSKTEKPVIAGVHYSKDPDLGLSAKVDLSDVPSPFLSGVIKPQPFIRWETQRGCPFRCSFCQHRESDSSQQRRHFKESRIMREIEWITRHPIINDIAVLDPTFNSGPNYLSVLTEFYNRGYAGKLSLQTRIEMVVPEFLDIVEKLNQRGQTVLEFGLQTIHRNEQVLIQRPNNMKKVDEVLKEVRRRNIPVEISLIFGLPGQTVGSFQASVDYCKEYGLRTIYAFPLMLLRGTPLYDNKKKMGLVESSDIHIDEIPRIQQGIPHVVASDTFTFSEWQQMAEIARSLDDYNREMANQINRTSLNKITDTLRQSWWGKTVSNNEADRKIVNNIGIAASPRTSPSCKV